MHIVDGSHHQDMFETDNEFFISFHSFIEIELCDFSSRRKRNIDISFAYWRRNSISLKGAYIIALWCDTVFFLIHENESEFFI